MWKKENKKKTKKNKAYLLNVVGKVHCNGKKFLLDLLKALPEPTKCKLKKKVIFPEDVNNNEYNNM